MKYGFLITCIFFLLCTFDISAQARFYVKDAESKEDLRVNFSYTLYGDAQVIPVDEEKKDNAIYYSLRPSITSQRFIISVKITKENYQPISKIYATDTLAQVSPIVIFLEKELEEEEKVNPLPMKTLDLSIKDFILEKEIKNDIEIYIDGDRKTYHPNGRNHYEFPDSKSRVQIQIPISSSYNQIDTVIELNRNRTVEILLQSRKKITLNIKDVKYENAPLEQVIITGVYEDSFFVKKIKKSNQEGKSTFTVSPLMEKVRFKLSKKGYHSIDTILHLTEEIHEIPMIGNQNLIIHFFNVRTAKSLEKEKMENLKIEYRLDQFNKSMVISPNEPLMIENLSPKADSIHLKIEDTGDRYFRKYEETFPLAQRSIDINLIPSEIVLQFADQSTGKPIHKELNFNYRSNSMNKNESAITTTSGDAVIPINSAKDDTLFITTMNASEYDFRNRSKKIILNPEKLIDTIFLAPLYREVVVEIYKRNGKKKQKAKIFYEDSIYLVNGLTDCILKIPTEQTEVKIEVERPFTVGKRTCRCIDRHLSSKINIRMCKNNTLTYIGSGINAIGIGILIKSYDTLESARKKDNEYWKNDKEQTQRERRWGSGILVGGVLTAGLNEYLQRKKKNPNRKYCECSKSKK